MKKIFQVFLIPSVFVFASPTFAATDSSVYLELGQDNQSGDSQYVDADFGLSRGARLMLGYGNSASGTDGTNSKSLYAGVSSDPTAKRAVAFTVSKIKEENGFDLVGARLDLMHNTTDWASTLSPEVRKIDFYDGGETTSVSSTGLGGLLGYYGRDPFYATLGYTAYSYQDTPQSLSTQTIGVGRFSNTISSSSGQSLGLDDYRGAFNLGYKFGAGKIGFKHAVAGSATDNRTTTSDSLYARYNFNDSWDTQGTLGRADDEVVVTDFASVALGYHW